MKQLFTTVYSIFFIIPIVLLGQSPGGTTASQELWLKADQPQTGGISDGQPVTLWHDLSGKGRDHAKYGVYKVPVYKQTGDLMNFQPALHFDSHSDARLIGPDFNVQADKAYYIFYVSKVEEGITGASVLYSLNATRNNNNGWYGGNPYFSTAGAGAAYRNINANSNGKKYGINTVIRPNGAILSQMSYYNSIPQSFTARAMNVTAGQSVIGNGTITTSGDPFYGDIQEIIVLSGPQNTYLSDIDLQKVHSYLSIKYGISLEAAASQPFPSYVNSSGTNIWDGTTNAQYQNYVFGIGRDDNSTLYQKQSTNYEKSTITVFVGGDLADLNNKNSGTLANNTFLMLGSNDREGISRYEYLSGHKFANGNLDEKINFRRNRTFKAKVTGQSRFTVNMKLNIVAKYVLVSPTENFDSSNTRIYKVVNDRASGVEVDDNDYVSFADSLSNPGGIDLLTELWLKTDEIPNTATDSMAITTWTDVSEYGRDHSKTGNTATPVIRNKKGLMNYHSHLEFNSFTALTAPSYLTADKSYYVFYVSEINTPGMSVLYALNSSLNGNNNNHGWYNYSPSFTDGGYAVANFRTHSNPNGKSYGVVAVERTNDTGVQQRITFNGATQSFAGSILAGIGTGESLIGARRVGNYLPFLGNLQEIIVLSNAKGTQMENQDLEKIISYLAIKYGITLDKDSQPNYLDSYGNMVWKGSANQGYQNDIFGIARDDNSGLYQKQSISYDRSIMTVFVGNDVTDLNIDNSGTLNNGDYLLFGSNGLDDYLLDYDHREGEPFANGKLLKDINFRNQVVLKAQTTGTSRFIVNIQPNLSAKMILVSSDGTFNPATTRVYPVESKVAKGVEIENGDYIGFAIYDNAPGGVVNGLRLWLRADDNKNLVINPGTNNLMAWKDQTSNANDYYYSLVNNTLKVPPVYTICDSRMNFFPSIYFSANASLAIDKGPMSTNKPQNSTSFVVYNSEGYTSGLRTYTHGFGGVNPTNASTRHPAIGFAPTEGYGRVATTSVIYRGAVKGFTLGATALHMARLSTYNAPEGKLIEHDFGGLSDKMKPSGATFGNEFLMASGGTIGSASVNSGQFDGLISEVFFYERELNEKEKSRIRTYLAMKYAITLYTVGSTETKKIPFDYVLSDITTTVWQGTETPYSAFHKNVAGLVRDDNSNLFVNKARSTDVDAIITMQAGNNTSCGQGTSSVLMNDFSGLFWGNNSATGITVLDSNANASCGGLESRMNRIWLVNKTNLDKQEVVISAGNSPLFEYNAAYKVFLLIANSADDINNNNWAKAIPGEWIDGEVKFKYTFTDENTYITFAGVKAPGVCTTCTFSGYKSINLSKIWTGSANRGKLNKTVDLGDGFLADITISDPGKVLRRGYPRNKGKTLELQRRGNHLTDRQPITTTITYTGGSAATSFEIYDIDSQAMRSDEVEVYGLCGGGIVKPKLTYVAPKKKSSYVISGNKATAKVSGSSSSSGYTATRGRVLVDFSTAVEQIVIVYNEKYNRTSTGNQTIGIGAFNLYCPKPLEINEDGLAFTLQVPESTLTCEEVPFTFRIVNTNCESKIVNLNDSLPSGMLWVRESLSIDDGAGTPTSNSYGETEQLSIQGIEVPGATTTTVTVRARFIADSTTTYTTRASINYINIFGDNAVYESCDVIDGCGVTSIKSIASGIYDPVTVDNVTTTSSCIAKDEIVTVSIQITNPNQALDEVTLSASFTEGFDYVANSLTSTFNPIGGTINAEEGGFEVEDFTLPTGTHIISFKVKAPAVLPIGSDELEINLDMTTSSAIDCATIDMSDANMDVIFPFCTYCTQDPNLSPSTEKSQIGITTLKQAQKEWPNSIPNGFIVLESKDKGFVITRTTTTLIPSNELVEGMIIYDIKDKCIKLYNGTDWNCIKRSCNK